jgi:hypothetical protein
MRFKRGDFGMEILAIVAVLGLWFALQMWILPRAGVPT